ncbi:MAG: CsgG/HfaB family protein [Caldimonas sp.]
MARRRVLVRNHRHRLRRILLRRRVRAIRFRDQGDIVPTMNRAWVRPSACRRPQGPRRFSMGWLARGLFMGLVLLGMSSAQAQTQWGMYVRESAARAGVEISRVVPDSPAAVAGLQAGDLVLGAEGRAVSSPDELASVANALAVGSPLNLRVARQGWERVVRLVAAARTPTLASFGLQAADQPADKPPGSGAAIASLKRDGEAERGGLKTGDVVLRALGQEVRSAADLEAIVGRMAAGTPLSLSVWRDGWEKALTLLPAGAPVPSGSVATPAQDTVRSLNDAIERANAAYAAADWTTAERHYKRVLELNVADHNAWARLAHVYLMQKRFDEAAAASRKALELGPAEAGTLNNLGLSLTTLGDPAQARAAYQRAIELAPNSVEPYSGMANAYYVERNWAAAERYYRLALDREPQRQTLWEALAASCAEQQKDAEAVAAYRRALETGPPKAFVLESLGYRLHQLKRYAEAEEALQQALRIEPSDVDVLLLLGDVQSDLGKTEQARMSWQKAADLDAAGRAGQLARQNLAALAPRPAPARVPVEPAPAATAGARPVAEPVGAAPGAAAARATAVPSAALAPPAAGAKAAVAIGDFQVKAAGAMQFIGDGMREMLLTSLHRSGRFVVVERMDIQGLAAEQSLSRSRMAQPGAAIAPSQMIVADIMVYGAVTEFTSEEGGSGFQFGVPKLPLTVGRQTKNAHMAIDVRVVDVASGRVLAAQRIVGQAKSSQTTFGTEVSVAGTQMPASFGSFRNTPMEQAIRECVQKATEYTIQSVPAAYFRYR